MDNQITQKDTLVIIPSFNEGRDIANVLRKVKNAVGDEVNMLIVDDGSSDDTADEAKKSGAEVISLPLNMGYGVALETGYRYAYKEGYKYVAQMDADGQHEPKCLKDLLRAVKENQTDLVIGSRFLSNCGYRAQFFRRLGMIVFSKITSWIIGQKITDSTSGFQAFNRDVLKFFINGLYPEDYPDADVLILLHYAGFRILEIPVIMYSKDGNKSMHAGIIKPIYYIFKMFLSIGMIFARPKLRR